MRKLLASVQAQGVVLINTLCSGVVRRLKPCLLLFSQTTACSLAFLHILLPVTRVVAVAFG
jgi:hypothetical protein